MKFTPRDTGELPRSNHNDPLEGTIPTFDVNRCSLPGSMFCFYLLGLGLAVTGAPAENSGTRIHGVRFTTLGRFAVGQSRVDHALCATRAVPCGTVSPTTAS